MSPCTRERLNTKIAPQRYDQPVSNQPPPPPSPLPAPWPPGGPTAPTRRLQWPAFAALLIAVVALGLAIGSWFRPAPDSKPIAAPPAATYSPKQVADAQTSVCGAYQQVRKAGDVAGARSGGTDPTAMLAVATSSRQVFDVGSRYLLTKLAELPATPPDLAAAVRKLASIYQQLAIDYLAEAADSDLDPLVRAGDEAHSSIERLCK
jgi:hypothetical protein